MHLWPSMRLRDSFKIGYVKKLEWNLHRMDSEKKKKKKKQQQQDSHGDNYRQKLLDDDCNSKGQTNDTPMGERLVAICRELLLIFSCCYCCFCCGACVEDEGNF